MIAGAAKKNTHGGIRCADVTGLPVMRLVAASAAIELAQAGGQRVCHFAHLFSRLCRRVAAHQQRLAGKRPALADWIKSGFGIGSDRTRIARVGIGHHSRHAGRKRLLDKGANECAAVPATDQRRFADKLVDAERPDRLVVKGMIRFGMGIVALLIADGDIPKLTMKRSIAGSAR